MAKGVLIGIDWKNEKIRQQFYEGPNPVLTLELLKGAIEKDFPDTIWTVYGDPEAMKIWSDWIVPEMLGENEVKS